MTYFSYRMKLFKYSKERERIRKAYSKDFREARKKRDTAEIQSLGSALDFEQSEPEIKLDS